MLSHRQQTKQLLRLRNNGHHSALVPQETDRQRSIIYIMQIVERHKRELSGYVESISIQHSASTPLIPRGVERKEISLFLQRSVTVAPAVALLAILLERKSVFHCPLTTLMARPPDKTPTKHFPKRDIDEHMCSPTPATPINNNTGALRPPERSPPTNQKEKETKKSDSTVHCVHEWVFFVGCPSFTALFFRLHNLYNSRSIEFDSGESSSTFRSI